MIRATLLCGLVVAGVSGLLLVPSTVRVEPGRRVLKSASGYQTVSMLDGGRTGLYYDVGEEAGKMRPDARRVVLLGMGGGEMLRAARRSLPAAELVGVEVDAHTGAQAISDFHVLDFGAQVVIEDGREWLEDRPVHAIDILLVDVFDDDALPARFRDEDFYRLAWLALRRGGLLVQNVYPARLAAAIEAAVRKAGFSRVSRRGLIEGNVLLFAEP